MTAAVPRQEKVAVQAQEKVAVPRQEAAGGQGQETAAAPKQEATLVAEVATLSAAARVVKEAALVGHSTRRLRPVLRPYTTKPATQITAVMAAQAHLSVRVLT